MAGENRPSSIEQCISDIAECPICHEVLQDNRCLPCLHMFCLKCLDSYRKGKPKGKPLPCPICRREFSIPKSTADLPRNFFVDKLLDAHKIKKQDVLPKKCEICMEDTCEVPKWRSTIGHPREPNSVALATRYCFECRQYICLSCERQHKRIKAIAWHKIIDSTSVNDSQALAPMPTYCITHKTKEAELFCQDCKMVICWQGKALSHSSHTSFDVISATKDLAAKLEEHIEQIAGLLHIKQGHIHKLTERQKLYTDKIEVESAKISREQRRLCRNITDNGDQLKKALTSSTSVHLNDFSALRRKFESDVAELSKHKIYIEQLIHLGNVSDLCEYTNTLMLKTARLAEEHTDRIIAPPVIDLSDADLHDLLTGKRTDIEHQYSDRFTDNEEKRKDNRNQLQDKPLQTDQLPGIQKGLRKVRSSVTGVRSWPTPSHIFATSEKKSNTLPLKNRKDKDFLKYEDWWLIKTIAPEPDRTVCGITLLDSMLYVVSQDDNNISVYSATEFIFLKHVAVERLINPNDIVSCKFDNCLYVCDWGTACIFRVKDKPRGKMEQINWSIGKDMGCLSVTTEHTVLMAGHLSGKLKEYTSNGELIRSIELEKGLKPWHAIRLDGSNMQYLICEGDSPSSFHRVCFIDLNGNVTNSFGEVMGCDEEHLCGPYHLAVDESGCILVNDCNNSRILLLSTDLKFINEIIPSSGNLLHRARRIYLDEGASRLYVAENAKAGSQTKDGRILVFSSCGINDSMV